MGKYINIICILLEMSVFSLHLLSDSDSATAGAGAGAESGRAEQRVNRTKCWKKELKIFHV